MANAIIFDTATGRIICVTTLREWDTPMSNEILYENAPTDIGGTHYVLNGEVVPRPVMPLVITGNHIEGIPVNSELWLENIVYTVDDGEVDIDFTYPGTYPVRITKFPYLDFNGEFTE